MKIFNEKFFFCILMFMTFSCASESASPIFIPEVAAVRTAAAIATQGVNGNFRGEIVFGKSCALPIPATQLYVTIFNEKPSGIKNETARFPLKDYVFDKNISLESAGNYRAEIRSERTEKLLASKPFKAQSSINLIFHIDCK
jgi:hypothetical protein